MQKKGIIDIFDLLPPEAFVQIDKLGYNFLKEHGYSDPRFKTHTYKRRKRK